MLPTTSLSGGPGNRTLQPQRVWELSRALADERVRLPTLAVVATGEEEEELLEAGWPLLAEAEAAAVSEAASLRLLVGRKRPDEIAQGK